MFGMGFLLLPDEAFSSAQKVAMREFVCLRKKFIESLEKESNSPAVVAEKLSRKTMVSIHMKNHQELLKNLNNLDPKKSVSFHIYDTAVIYDEEDVNDFDDDDYFDEDDDDDYDYDDFSVYMRKTDPASEMDYTKMLQLIKDDSNFKIVEEKEFASILYIPKATAFYFKQLKNEDDFYVLELIKQFTIHQSEYIKMIRFHQYWYKNIFFKDVPLTNRMIAALMTSLMQWFEFLPAVHWYCKGNKENLFKYENKANTSNVFVSSLHFCLTVSSLMYTAITEEKILIEKIFFPFEGRLLDRDQMLDSARYNDRIVIYDFFTENGSNIEGNNLAEALDEVAWVRLYKYFKTSSLQFEFFQ